jgi:Cys-tRNA(Pro)/Cys-tRNA(Cys) deacylase
MTSYEHHPVFTAWQDKCMTGGTPATLALDRLNIRYFLHAYEHDPQSNAFGIEAANALDLDPMRIFKTLIATVEGRLTCALVPVAAKLDLKALAAEFGAKRAEMAEPAKAQRATGYVVGGISPLGHRTTIPVVLDCSVENQETVFVSAGKRGLQLELAPADLIRASAGRMARIATSVEGTAGGRQDDRRGHSGTG